MSSPRVNFWAPQGPDLGCLFLPLYINDLDNPVRFPSPFPFTDDNGLLNFQGAIRAINKTLNKIVKTKTVLYKSSNKCYDADLKIKLCRKRIHASRYGKYLNVFIDANLNWKHHINKISTKLIKGIGILSKLQHFVNKDILLSAYYAIFNSHLADILLV